MSTISPNGATQFEKVKLVTLDVLVLVSLVLLWSHAEGRTASRDKCRRVGERNNDKFDPTIDLPR